MRNHPIFPYFLLLCVSVFWGSSYFFIKIALESFPPVTLIAYRCLLAVLIYLPFIIWQRVELPRGWPIWRLLFLQAFLNNYGSWILLSFAQQYIDSALAGVLNSTVPIFVFLITFFISRHESTSLWKFFGVILGFAGTAMVLYKDGFSLGDSQIWASLLVILVSIFYGFANIQTHKFNHIKSLTVSFCTLSISTIITIPLSILIDKPWNLTISPHSLMAASMLGIFSTALTFFIFLYVIRALGSIKSSSNAYLRSMVSVGLGVFVLGETLETHTLIGIFITIFGVFFINFGDLIGGKFKRNN